jgi:hypothetical protein
VSFGESFGLSGHLFPCLGPGRCFPSLLSWQGDWCSFVILVMRLVCAFNISRV